MAPGRSDVGTGLRQWADQLRGRSAASPKPGIPAFSTNWATERFAPKHLTNASPISSNRRLAGASRSGKTPFSRFKPATRNSRRLFSQALEDMASLRLPIERSKQLEFVPAAGVPWFVALFGRDSLIASLQNALVYPDFARGTLDVLGARQASKRDDFRDAEPGKILHELRFGELAHFNVVPHAPYYGSADATVLYLIVLHTAWRSTGDRSSARTSSSDRAAMSRLDRQVRGSRWRRVSGISDALTGRI